MDADIYYPGTWVRLAQEHRLAAFRLLVQAGEEGLPCRGAWRRRLARASARMSFHLAQLSHAGLIRQRAAEAVADLQRRLCRDGRADRPISWKIAAAGAKLVRRMRHRAAKLPNDTERKGCMKRLSRACRGRKTRPVDRFLFGPVRRRNRAVVKPDYAKWMLEDPRVNFAISCKECGAVKGVEHLGIQVEDGAELADVYGRLKAADGPVLEEGATTCCYAQIGKKLDRRPRWRGVGGVPHPMASPPSMATAPISTNSAATMPPPPPAAPPRSRRHRRAAAEPWLH
jgi:hypothetical protein